jgi:ABC-2 type transport system permease protein
VKAAALVLGKDLRLLVRTPAVLLILVVFPLLVAALVALALQSDERRPDVAVVNLDTSGRTVAVGESRLSIDDYIARLSEDVDVRRLDAESAASALDAGRVSAVLTIPAGFISDLQAGVRQPALLLDTSRRSPIEADAIVRNLEAAVYRLNQRLAIGYVTRFCDWWTSWSKGAGQGSSAVPVTRSACAAAGPSSRASRSGCAPAVSPGRPGSSSR